MKKIEEGPVFVNRNVGELQIRVFWRRIELTPHVARAFIYTLLPLPICRPYGLFPAGRSTLPVVLTDSINNLCKVFLSF